MDPLVLLPTIREIGDYQLNVSGRRHEQVDRFRVGLRRAGRRDFIDDCGTAIRLAEYDDQTTCLSLSPRESR